MRRSARGIVGLAVVGIAGLQLVACGRTPASSQHVSPAHVEKIEGTSLSRITLTPKASERLGIETAFVAALGSSAGTIVSQGDTNRLQAGVRLARAASASGQIVVPYAAVIYDAHGDTWVYTNPQPLVYVRHRIEIDHIEGDRAVLKAGPAVGTAIVTLGTAELFGTEFGVGH
jgi:hypothetical protein